MKKRNNVPDSGTRMFSNGCRVLITASQLVGTVLDFENSLYLVRYMNQKGILETKYFEESALVEQHSLPFEEVPF